MLGACVGLGLSSVELILPALPASAVTCGSFTWLGLGADANWSTPGNWQGGVAPAPSSCASLTFPSLSFGSATTNNDILNLEITSLTINKSEVLQGQAVYIGDASTQATVTDTSSAVIALAQTVQNSVTYNVSSGSTLNLAGSLSDPSLSAPGPTLTMAGAGIVDITSSSTNSFNASVAVTAGTLQVTNSSALGAPTNGLTVGANTTLQLGSANPSPLNLPQPIHLAGKVLATDANDVLSGAVTLSSGATLDSNTSSSGLTLTAPIGGAGPLTVNNGTSGTVTFASSTNNSYTGGTTVSAGTLALDVPSGLAAPGALTVNAGANVFVQKAGQLDATSATGLTLNGNATVDLEGNPTSVQKVVLNSTSTTAAPTIKSTGSPGNLSVAASLVSQGTGAPGVISSGFQPGSSLSVQTADSLAITGPLSGSGGLTLGVSSGTACASGTSTSPCVALLLSGNSPSYQGAVTVSAGVLDVTGSLSGSSVTVNGGTLTGTGTIGPLTVTSGTLAPGTTVATGAQNFTDSDQPGVLNVGTLVFNGGTFSARIDGAAAGNGTTSCSGYDQVSVASGPVTLGGGTLSVSTDKTSSNAPCFVPQNPQTYSVIANPSAAETGTFTGLASGATVTEANFNYQFVITYPLSGLHAGDVVLTSKVTTTVTVNSPSPNPVTYGTQVVLKATVSQIMGTTAPTGQVTFTDSVGTNPFTVTCSESGNNTVTLSASQATCTTTTALPGGTNSIVADYHGDSNFPGNSSPTPLAEQVNPQGTTTVIGAGSTNPSTYGQPVTFIATVTPTGTDTATVANPGGTVDFFVNSGTQPLADCTAVSVSTSGGHTTATCNTSDLPGGNDTVTAKYNGDGSYAASTTAGGSSQTVHKATSTTTISPTAPGQSVYGQVVNYTATVTPSLMPSGPSGTVTFYDSVNGGQPSAIADCTSVPVASASAQCNTATLPVGTNEIITANYSGDGNYTQSTTANGGTQTVAQASTTTAFPSLTGSAPVGQPVTYTGVVAPVSPGHGTPTGTVSFSDGGHGIPACQASQLSTSNGVTSAMCTVTYQSVGQHSITATYSGDTNFSVSTTSSALTETIGQSTTTTALSAGNPDPSVAGQAVTFTATVSPASSGVVSPTGTVTFSANGNPLPDCTSVTVNPGGGEGRATCVTTNLPFSNAALTNDSITASYSGDANFNPSASSTVFQSVRLSADQLGADPVLAAFQANSGLLWTVGQRGWTNWGVGMAPGTSPAITSLPNGGYQIAFQANSGTLWTVGTAGWTNWNLGMARGTSPAITSLPNGGYQIAIHAADGNLWTVGTAGWVDWGLGMAAGTNPGITSLPNGGYQIAFQANTGTLWTVGTGGWVNWGLGMAPGTSPSIAAPNGGYQIAFQANNRNLWTVGTAGWVNWGVGMAVGSSPGITSMPNGGYQIAFQANTGTLWSVGTAGWMNWDLGLASGASPAIASDQSGHLIEGYQGFNNDLWTVGSQGFDWSLGTAPGTNISLLS